MSLDRRSFLSTSLGMLAVPAAGLAMPTLAQAASESSQAALDPILLLRKLKLRSDDGVMFWWLQGPKLGQVGATLTPLYTSSVGSIQRVRLLEDGGLELTHLEMIFMLDLETGEALDEWRNPYTGEVIPVTFNPVGPITLRYQADNSRVLPTEVGGTPLEATATSYPPIIVGDDVFLRDESVARVFTPGRKTPFEVNDIAIYHGSMRDIADPAVAMGGATVFFGEVTGWQGWMNMGDRPGSLTSRMVGRKCRNYADLPEAWRARLSEVAPRIADDPIGALDRPAARFER